MFFYYYKTFFRCPYIPRANRKFTHGVVKQKRASTCSYLIDAQPPLATTCNYLPESGPSSWEG